MLDPETTRNVVEWRQARPEDAAIWVSITRRSADQILFETEDSQIARYKEEDAEQQAQRYLLWRDDEPVGRLRFFLREDTSELDGLVLLPEAGGRVAAQVVTEALVRSSTDADQIAMLLQHAYTNGPDNLHPDLAGWRAEIRAIMEGRMGPFIPECCFVTEHSLDRFNLAGVVMAHLERGVPRIHDLAVAPSFRHVGLGQLLAVKAMQRLHELGYSTVLIYVTLGIPAVNLYHRLGFIEAGPTYIEAERMLTR